MKKWKLWAQARYLADFPAGYERDSSARLFHCFFLLSFSSSLPGLELGQNPWCLASGPNEAQTLMSHWKNLVRDTVIGNRWICSDSERRALHGVWAITEESAGAMECGVASFFRDGWIHMLMSGRIIPSTGEPPTPLSFDSDLELSCHLWVCHLARTSRFSWIWLVILDPFDFNQLTLCPWAMSFFQK